ncbi:MAG: hypothetical protein EHM61_03800 [Acidobacteria bacterium]|nr:MAG: hypothetical protein EHM61_03800 [Acidobacteriota bacterium]
MLHRAILAVLLVTLSGVAGAQQSNNLALLKRDTQIFERIVYEVLKQHFKNPFAITADPRGGYLQGFGVTVSFQLNINRATIRTPFGDLNAPRSQGERTKAEQIRTVKESMKQCLADYGQTIKQLGPHDRIAVQAHIVDRNELDPAKATTVLVLMCTKDDVNLLATGKLPVEKFKERVHVLEY